jgi:O-antigen/teichoic acid export membrane protein
MTNASVNITTPLNVPYQNILGDEGLYAYQQVYPIVALGLILSMNAIPSAVTQNNACTPKYNQTYA